MAAADSEEEELTLSPHALDALKQFYSERDARTEQFERLKADAEKDAVRGDEAQGASSAAESQQAPLSMSAFSEDWNESQFWYSDETANLLAQQLLDGATGETTITVISAPSVFISLKNLLATKTSDSLTAQPRLVLLEHDERFAVFPEFVFYDFAQPFRLPGELKGSADRLICDPPFLSEDCQTKVAMTARWLAKSTTAQPTTNDGSSPPKLILCTGERMESLVNRLYKPLGLMTTDYEPVHARGLSNEFYCYANFECEAWKWRTGTSTAL